MRFSSCVRSTLLVVVALALAAPVGAAAATVVANPATPHLVYRNFTMLTYNTIDPMAAELRYTLTNPGRRMVETVVDNEMAFDRGLAGLPSGVNLTTDEAYLIGRHSQFLGLTSSDTINIMVSIHGDLDSLENFALYTLGLPEIASIHVAPGTTDGMLIVQYSMGYNFAYLFGEENYTQGRQVSYADRPIPPIGEVDASRGPAIWILENLIRAALEEPEWNDNHYLSGQVLGCLGFSPGTAYDILYTWEVFEQLVNDLGEQFGQDWDVGEDMWGVIWDLIWGMTGYYDGADGWFADD